jgi:SAM-dependent methyltransferase
MSYPEVLSRHVTDMDYMVQKRLLDSLTKHALPYVHGRMLDIGSGTKPLESFFSGLVTEHVGLDHPASLHGLSLVDVVATAYETGQPPDSYDTILCTAVLEHLEEPEAALREALRVLRPGGYAIYTVPLFWHIHEEPRDYYRFTPHGLNYLFGKAGFEVKIVYPCGGYWVTAGTMFNYYVSSVVPPSARYVAKGMVAVNNLVCLALDHCHKTRQFAWMHLVVAQKPAG